MNAQLSKRQLLKWVNGRIKPYDLLVVDFGYSWRTAMAFCALIHSHPNGHDWIDYDSLDENRRKKNFKIAFNAAEKYLGVLKLLRSSDFNEDNVLNEEIVFQYIINIYRAFIMTGVVKEIKAGHKRTKSGKALRPMTSRRFRVREPARPSLKNAFGPFGSLAAGITSPSKSSPTNKHRKKRVPKKSATIRPKRTTKRQPINKVRRSSASSTSSTSSTGTTKKRGKKKRRPKSRPARIKRDDRIKREDVEKNLQVMPYRAEHRSSFNRASAILIGDMPPSPPPLDEDSLADVNAEFRIPDFIDFEYQQKKQKEKLKSGRGRGRGRRGSKKNLFGVQAIPGSSTPSYLSGIATPMMQLFSRRTDSFSRGLPTSLSVSRASSAPPSPPSYAPDLSASNLSSNAPSPPPFDDTWFELERKYNQ